MRVKSQKGRHKPSKGSQNERPHTEPKRKLPHEISLETLPREIIFCIAEYLIPTGNPDLELLPPDDDLVPLSQTCRRLRNVLYPIANQNFWFDETVEPGTPLKMAIYSLTEPFAEHVRFATFRLVSSAYWTYPHGSLQFVTQELKVLRGLLRKKAAESENEAVWKFLESQVEEHGTATIPTILLYQFRGLRRLELSASVSAASSRFLFLTLQYFDPPFKLEEFGTSRFQDLMPVHYQLLERFLRLGVPKIGIDYRWWSTSGFPKLKPIESKDDDLSTESSDEEEDEEEAELTNQDYDDPESIASEDIEDMEYIMQTDTRPIQEVMDESYPGYVPFGHRDCAPDQDIKFSVHDYESDTDEFSVKDLRLWMDEAPPRYDPIMGFYRRIRGLEKLQITLDTMPGRTRYMGLSGDMTDPDWFTQILSPQMQTLKSLSLWFGKGVQARSDLPNLTGFSNLRQVHIHLLGDYKVHFHNYKGWAGGYFTTFLPPTLESLRYDIFSISKSPAEAFVSHATLTTTRDFPCLRIVLGIRKDGMPREALHGIKRIWDQLPLSVEISPAMKRGRCDFGFSDGIWRRASKDHVPVQILSHIGDHRSVMEDEDSLGPFEERMCIDEPYNTRFGNPNLSSQVHWLLDSIAR